MSHPQSNKIKKDLTHAEQIFFESQNHCALCNSSLEITIESYLEEFSLKEEAVCPTCKIKTRVKSHKLQ